ncbi:MAG: hypothetical protein ACOVNN_10430, partial [Limnohabitans sp.]
AYVGQAHDAAFQTHTKILRNQDPTCTIEPNTGVTEVHGRHLQRSVKAHGHTDKNLDKPEFLSSFCPRGELA